MSDNKIEGPSTQKGKPRYEMIRPLQGEVLPPANVRKLTPMNDADQGMLNHIANLIRLPPAPESAGPIANNNSGHSRENFDVRAMAQVATQFGKQDALIVGGITLVLTIGIYYFLPGDVTLYGLGWLVVWGSISLYAMNRTRGQAYRHSPTGVAIRDSDNAVRMHSTDAQVEIHRIDKAADTALGIAQIHADTMLKRWRLEAGKDGE